MKLIKKIMQKRRVDTKRKLQIENRQLKVLATSAIKVYDYDREEENPNTSYELNNFSIPVEITNLFEKFQDEILAIKINSNKIIIDKKDAKKSEFDYVKDKDQPIPRAFNILVKNLLEAVNLLPTTKKRLLKFNVDSGEHSYIILLTKLSSTTFDVVIIPKSKLTVTYKLIIDEPNTSIAIRNEEKMLEAIAKQDLIKILKVENSKTASLLTYLAIKDSSIFENCYYLRNHISDSLVEILPTKNIFEIAIRENFEQDLILLKTIASNLLIIDPTHYQLKILKKHQDDFQQIIIITDKLNDLTINTIEFTSSQVTVENIAIKWVRK